MTGNSASTPTNNQQSSAITDTADKLTRYLRHGTWILITVYLVMCTLLGIALGPLRFSLTVFVSVYAIALASASIGGLLGFIFAIPRALQSSELDEKSAYTRFVDNTNLEQISDWLTKILVGVGLVQIGSLRPALADLGNTLKPMLGNEDASGGIGVLLAIGSLVSAFLIFYIWTRVILPRFFASSGQEISNLYKATAMNQAVGNTREVIDATYEDALVEELGETTARPIIDRARITADEKTILVDFSHVDEGAPALSVLVTPDTPVNSFLNMVFASYPVAMQPFSYGKNWLLKRSSDGKVFNELGTRWAQSKNKNTDDRPLSEVGIEPGDHLEVIGVRTGLLS